MSTNGLLNLIKKISKDDYRRGFRDEKRRTALESFKFIILEEPMLLNYRMKNMFNSTFLMIAIAFRQEDLIKMIINEKPNLDVCNNVFTELTFF